MPATLTRPDPHTDTHPDAGVHAVHADADAQARVARAWTVLDAVPDPEIPVVSIRDLGILREVAIADDGALEIVITPTYSGCPAMAEIAEDIGRALGQANLGPWKIRTVLAPAWTTDWITAEGRDKLRAYGIAPPARCADHGVQTRPLRFVPRHHTTGATAATAAMRASTADSVTCPHCGSADTEPLSQFGSTACKALYRCRTCREPFDYFKPY
ncbi:phenylacetate-CoA oxygenase subunit PaaJ [Cupriavidus gilardii]|uniref:1,2-phenylacetyl-CoA epoxidase subunit PaaD n=1 Tax=Cupriavidus gilardii TaxID=82541 RepID=UPI001EE52249|nr:1,2-phenylacetyl-CoA epoxidase subunit PaaD [Cupriavidus gilardii]MCG5263287.1 phenylacetate-CoA oxygenase subunit PaaJ [Cupriavidus gilardii]MDF9432627.1 phenylacetate-CoA oxygenase subunit PaaJ [Cupriavidus gilardii]